MRVRLTQLDGALPNLAIMNLASWHMAKGDDVTVTRSIEPDLFEPSYDRVYGSVLFSFSGDRLERFRTCWPGAIVGGTGSGTWQTVSDDVTGEDWDGYDYSGYPDFEASIGFTQRGCRLKCKFCVVPKKEGKNRSVATIGEIWRGVGHPKKIHVLDNDFFGQPREQWQERIKEIRDGGFRICLSQGINVRLLDQEAAEALATIEYRDTKFTRKRLYTAWDNLKDEGIFFKGIDTLERAGVKPTNVMAYMLIGYDKSETWDRIWHRFNRMVERGIMPYPMVFDRSRKDLCAFQRWVNMGLYRIVPWAEYKGKAA